MAQRLKLFYLEKVLPELKTILENRSYSPLEIGGCEPTVKPEAPATGSFGIERIDEAKPSPNQPPVPSDDSKKPGTSAWSLVASHRKSL